ncbi:unnamed protein product [Clavelina lepadiformis]|uniref:Carbohydrate sulfotransferase n=1 Tax=Clavelina lepadiformis TaxID=159417 RepID=A0ABP0F2E1_CLALP
MYVKQCKTLNNIMIKTHISFLRMCGMCVAKLFTPKRLIAIFVICALVLGSGLVFYKLVLEQSVERLKIEHVLSVARFPERQNFPLPQNFQFKAEQEQKEKLIQKDETSSKTESLTQEHEDEFMLRMERRMKKRRKLLKEKCEELGLPDKTEKRVRFVLSRPYNLTYCFVPKAGCTNWKKVILLLNNYVSSYEELAKFHHDYIHGIVAKQYRTDTVGFPKNTDHHLKMIVVRDPYDRLLSSYNDKLGPHSDGSRPQYHTTSEKIHNNYQSPTAIKQLALATFEEFINYLTQGKNSINTGTVNNHWTTYNSICQPCALKYDVISHLETIDEDARYVMKLINAPKRISFPTGYGKSGSSSTSLEKILKTYKHLESSLIEKLYETYRSDFELFGYNGSLPIS